jgi:hypothetical protein
MAKPKKRQTAKPKPAETGESARTVVRKPARKKKA